MSSDLRGYLAELFRKKELVVIKKKVSTKYELAAITAAMDGSRAVLFEKVKESKFQVVSNLVGTKERFAQAVRAPVHKIHDKVIWAIKHASKPRIVVKGKFMENQSRNLFILPIITHFEKEPGPFITSSIIYTRNQEVGTQNSSFHRLLRLDDRHFSVRMVEGRHLYRSYMYAKGHGEDLRVAITVGVHPAVSIAGAYQAEWGRDELEIANELLGRKLTLAMCPYSGMLVPSEAEIVMEGRILKDKNHKEWMVEMLRTYDFKRMQPVFELDRMYYRNKPIFHDILSGYGEHRLLMGMPIEAKLNRNLKQVLPYVIVVDDDIDPSDPVAVEYAMATRFQADKDLVIMPKVRGSSLDPSSDQKNLLTTKMGVDATKSFLKHVEGFEIAKIPRSGKVSIRSYLR
ncbi:MAG: UbiD family decarboxylase [Thaumarchaeota archaeon]|nr:MAG: UbiD family decarboxylase [Nitrososphaerota archaeon]